MSEEKKQPVYVMVPKKLVNTAVAVFIVLFVGNLASFQYANYVDRQSNQYLCGIVKLSVRMSLENPPSTELQREGAVAMLLLSQKLHCK